MAVSGRLEADFSDFLDATSKAEEALRRMEGGAGKVETSLSRMTADAPARINTLRESLGRFDGILASVGVNASGPIRAISEIGDVAGKTVASIGLLGTAGLVLSTAIAGWKVGGWVRGLADLDEQVRKDTVSLGLFADVAAEEAGAGADVLALATKHAGREITDMTEAMAINTKFVQDASEAARANADVVTEQTNVMSDARRMWDMQAVAAEKAAASSTIFGDGLPPVTEKTQSLLEVLDGILATQEPLQSGLKFTAETIGHVGDEADDAAKKLEEFKKRQLAGGTFSIQPLTQTEISRLIGSSSAAFEGTSGEGILWKRLAELEKLEGTYTPRDAQSYFEMVQAQTLLAQLRMWAAGKDRPPGFRGGVTNFEGGIARVHQDELLVNLPRGTDVIPAGRSGTVQHFHINLSGMVGDRAGLARALKTTLVDGSKAQGQRLS